MEVASHGQRHPQRRTAAHTQSARRRGSRPVIAFPGPILFRRAVLVLLVPARHHIDATEPAVEVDVGAAPAAERPELAVRRLAANRAGTGTRLFGHAITPSTRTTSTWAESTRGASKAAQCRIGL